MAYTHTTRAVLRGYLADRLGDASNVFWSTTELNLWINEAMRTWAAASGYWREQASFNTAAGTTFYALQTSLSTLLGFSITDRNLIESIQYHLLEDATSQSVWNGTEMYDLDEVADALQHRRNQFLVETGQILVTSSPAVAASTSRVSLSDSIIDVRRAVWLTSGGVRTHIWRVDELALTLDDPAWEAAGTPPEFYSILAPRPVEMQLAPVPSANGNLDLITVSAGADFDPANSATNLGVFDNFAWVIKWGAMADLLRGEGQEADPTRAAICEQHWREGIELAKIAAVVVQVQIAGVHTTVHSLFDLDTGLVNWENETQATPTDIAIVGSNLIACRPIPDGVTSLTFDVVRNAPVPANDAAQVLIGREEINAILDYAEHLARFKTAGRDFAGSLTLVRNFYRLAATYNNRLRASALFLETFGDISQKEEEVRRRVVPITGA